MPEAPLHTARKARTNLAIKVADEAVEWMYWRERSDPTRAETASFNLRQAAKRYREARERMHEVEGQSPPGASGSP